MREVLKQRVKKWNDLARELEDMGLHSEGCNYRDFDKCYFANSGGEIVCYIDNIDKDNPKIVWY